MNAPTPEQASRLRAGIRDYTCGLCGEEFGSNCDPGDIQCTNDDCEARLCPCCGAWFTEDGEVSHAVAVSVEQLGAALRARRVLVDVDDAQAVSDGMWLVVPARPRDLAVQLLSGIDLRLTDDPSRPAPELAALRELLDEIGVMAANAPEDGDSFGVLEEIAMRIAAAGVPDSAPGSAAPEQLEAK